MISLEVRTLDLPNIQTKNDISKFIRSIDDGEEILYFKDQEYFFDDASYFKFIKEVYPKVKISKRIDIKSLTWQEDGKTIEDRVKLYCDYAHEVLKTDKNISILRNRLIHNFIRIIETEDIVVLNQVLRRVAEDYPYVQISNGSCECCNSGGIELVKNVSKWPPFHPICKCVAIPLTEEEYEKIKE